MFTILSLFSGCGGLDLGFLGGFEFLEKKYKKHNFEIAWSNDIEKNACETYYKNFNHNIVCGDIRDLIKDDQEKMFEAERGTLY